MGNSPKLPREFLISHADRLMEVLRPVCKDVVLCGSLRRMSPTSSDIDLVVTDPTVDLKELIESVMGTPAIVEQEGMNARSCYVFKQERSTPIRVDIWKADPDSLGAATLYATGPGLANVAMRRWARHLGFELTFEGVYDAGLLVASRTEEDCLEILGIPWVSPEERTDYESWVGPFLDIMNEEEKQDT